MVWPGAAAAAWPSSMPDRRTPRERKPLDRRIIDCNLEAVDVSRSPLRFTVCIGLRACWRRSGASPRRAPAPRPIGLSHLQSIRSERVLAGTTFGSRPAAGRAGSRAHALKREILISGSPRETRVAILEDDRLVELLVDRPDARRMVGDIYLGKVDAVLPGIQAAFVEIGAEKSAFLHASDLIEADEDEDPEDREPDDADDENGNGNGSGSGNGGSQPELKRRGGPPRERSRRRPAP